VNRVRPGPQSGWTPLVLIRGAGDLASGVAIRLFRSGFPVVMTEIERPLVVRRTVAFAQAIYDGETTVEDVLAVRADAGDALEIVREGAIPVLIDADATCRQILRPSVLVDGIMAKRNTGTGISDAELVVALGPGFTAGVDSHAVVETNRGHNLGRVIWQGMAEPDTGRPGALPGVGANAHRALYAPASGYVVARAEIGDRLRKGDFIAAVDTDSGQESVITATFDGVLRGLIHPSVAVITGMKIGDLDPRIQPTYCQTVSDKSLAIGGGVLEAVMHAWTDGRLSGIEGGDK
jgi:xanthine dehydrogenase accessory factor